MKKNENSIYDIVDENFMSNFSGKHIGFMKDYYYKVYYNFCRHIKKKILPHFFMWMPYSPTASLKSDQSA